MDLRNDLHEKSSPENSGHPTMSEIKLAVIVPLFNDWAGFAHLVRELDETLPVGVRELRVVAVNDGSTEPMPDGLFRNLDLERIHSIVVVNLTCNLGHQRAIAIGMSRAAQMDIDAAVIMDSDGEDRPQDVSLLIDKHIAQPNHIIAASRARRSEGSMFLFFYVLYKKSFKLLTGHEITFGNFSLVPIGVVEKLLHMPSLWNHYAATVLRSRLLLSLVPIPRGRRYGGKSHMGFVGLVVHGLSAISVFSDAMLTRMLMFFVSMVGIGFLGGIAAVALRLFTDLATPGWASAVVSSLTVICLQALLLTMMSAFLVLSNRSIIALPPKELSQAFIGQVVTLFRNDASSQTMAPSELGRSL